MDKLPVRSGSTDYDEKQQRESFKRRLTMFNVKYDSDRLRNSMIARERLVGSLKYLQEAPGAWAEYTGNSHWSELLDERCKELKKAKNSSTSSITGSQLMEDK